MLDLQGRGQVAMGAYYGYHIPSREVLETVVPVCKLI